jgi:hypothetical protein
MTQTGLFANGRGPQQNASERYVGGPHPYRR